MYICNNILPSFVMLPQKNRRSIKSPSCPSVRPSVSQSVNQLVRPSVRPLVSQSVDKPRGVDKPSRELSMYICNTILPSFVMLPQKIRGSIQSPGCPSVRPSVRPPDPTSVRQSVRPSGHTDGHLLGTKKPNKCPSVRTSVRPSVSQSVCQSFSMSRICVRPITSLFEVGL